MEGMLADAVKGVINRLSEEERYIVECHVMSNQPVTFEMMAVKLCMTRDEVRLLVITTRDKLREMLVGLVEPGMSIPARAKFVTIFKPGNA